MIPCPIPRRQCDSAISSSSRCVSLLRLALLLGLLLQLCPVQGQFSQKDSVCTIDPRPVLVGLTSSPEDDWFGDYVSLSQDGTIAAMGAPYYEPAFGDGYVQVFRFKNKVWTQLGKTILGDTYTYTSSNALSNDGLHLAVGGSQTSSVRVFHLVDDNWEPFGNNITNRNGENIGHALAFSGDGTILAASSPYANGGAGKVRVFEAWGGAWIQRGKTLQGYGEEDFFGVSISLSEDGSRLAVGIPDSSYPKVKGLVRVYDFMDNDWVQIGRTLEGTRVGDGFGNCVGLSSDGQTLAVGAPSHDGNSKRLGSVQVFSYGSDGQWFKPGSMLIGKSEGESLGVSVALSGDASMLVARGYGLLRLFEADGDEWIEVGEERTDSIVFNYGAISRDGSTVMGGASAFDISCQQGQLQ